MGNAHARTDKVPPVDALLDQGDRAHLAARKRHKARADDVARRRRTASFYVALAMYEALADALAHRVVTRGDCVVFDSRGYSFCDAPGFSWRGVGNEFTRLSERDNARSLWTWIVWYDVVRHVFDNTLQAPHCHSA